MADQKQPTVIIVERARVHLYKPDEQVTATIDMPPTAINDLEIVSEKELDKVIHSFIFEQQVATKETVVILHDSFIFTQVLTEDQVRLKESSEEFKRVVDTFAKEVPFEDVVVKPLKFQKQTVLLGVNFSLYETLLQSFIRVGLQVEAVVPGFAFPAESQTDIKGYVDYYHKFGDTLAPTNIWVAPRIDQNQPEVVVVSSKRQWYLVGALLLVIFLLIGVMLWDQQRRKARQAELDAANAALQPAIQTVVPTPQPSTVPSEEPSVTLPTEQVEPVDIEELLVVIRNGSGIEGQASELRELFLDIGFTQVQASNATQQITGQTIIAYSPRVDRALRQRIEGLLTATDITYVVREVPDQAADVTITTAEN